MIDMPWRSFLSPELGKGAIGKYPYFVDTGVCLKRSVGLVERSFPAKNQINPFIPFDKTPTCDRQTDRHHRHRAIANNRASIPSRGQKGRCKGAFGKPLVPHVPVSFNKQFRAALYCNYLQTAYILNCNEPLVCVRIWMLPPHADRDNFLWSIGVVTGPRLGVGARTLSRLRVRIVWQFVSCVWFVEKTIRTAAAGGLWRCTVYSAACGWSVGAKYFYRAMLCIRGTSHGPASVCPSVTSRSSTKTAERIELVLAWELPPTRPTLC